MFVHSTITVASCMHRDFSWHGLCCSAYRVHNTITIQVNNLYIHVRCMLTFPIQEWQWPCRLLVGGLAISSVGNCLHSSLPLWALLALYCSTLESVSWCSSLSCFYYQRLRYFIKGSIPFQCPLFCVLHIWSEVLCVCILMMYTCTVCTSR